MSKEKEIIKSFLKSEFHWVTIGSEQGWAKGNSCRRIFEGIICSRASTSHISYLDNKPLKTWKKIEDCMEWFPENILHKSFFSHNIDVTGKNRRWDQLTKQIDEDTQLLFEIGQGSISGVGYNLGWQIRIGLIYKNFIFKLYDYKTSNNQFELNAYYDLEYLRSLDFSNMKPLERKDDAAVYLPEYYIVSTSDKISAQEMADVLSLMMDGDTLTFSDEFMHNFSNIRGFSADDNCKFGKDTLTLLKPKKIILQDNFNIKSKFNIPESLEEIILDFKKRNWSEGNMEEFIDQNKDLGKYLKCSDDCEKIAARELFNKQKDQYNSPVSLTFEHKELKGFVYSNQYQLALLEDFYKDKEWAELKVADFVIEIPIEEFWDCLKINEKIKTTKKLSAGMEYFGYQIGYTAWFPTECDVRPNYKFDKEAQES